MNATTNKIETFFVLSENSSTPIWMQLKMRFIYMITTGYYKPGDKLPSIRGLAESVGVNPNTISKVYENLEQDGYVETHQRLGVFVRNVPELHADVREAARMETVDYVARLSAFGLTLEDVEEVFASYMVESKQRRTDEFARLRDLK